MTTLGTVLTGRANGKTAAQPFDIHSLVAAVGPSLPGLPSYTSITASIDAWTNQDDDAHEPCSLTACRAPLHPGPCKGWKHTLHSIAPGTYHQVEAERVRKANARRLKRIADLKAQNKPIPRKLLTEIKAKPAPAHSMTATPLGQVGQKADLAGGQAHHAGQAITNAAGIKPSTPLPLGPKQKKPSITGRGPAFVITQPKVTDQYKLDKAEKITPQEWAGLSAVDRTAIRSELTAIKARGFGPQQTRADALLTKLPAPTTVKQAASVPAHPGRVSLGQATKTVTPQLPAPASAPARGQRDQHGILNTPKVGGSVSSTSVGLPSGYRISRDGMGYSLTYKAPGSVFGAKIIRTSNDQASLEDYAKRHHDAAAPIIARHKAAGTSPSAELSKLTPDKVDAHHAAPAPAPAAPSPPTGLKPSAPLAPGTAPHVQQAVAVANRTAPKAQMSKTHTDAYAKLTKAEFDQLDPAVQKTIRDDLANARAKFLDPKKQQAAKDLLDRFGSRHPAPASPTAPTTPAPASTGGKKTYTVTYNGKTVTRSSSKPYTHASVVRWSDGTEEVASFHTSENAALKGVLTAQQKANGAQVVKAVAVKADDATATPSAPKGYSDPMNRAVREARSGLDVDEVVKAVGQLSHPTIGNLTDADRKTILDRINHLNSPRAAAYKRIIEHGSPAMQSRKWDHQPSIAELYAEETKTGIARAGSPKAADALSAADPGSKLPTDVRVKALGGLDKAEFDALKPDEQRQITDALQHLHHDGNTSMADTDEAETAITRYTGQHPAMHRLAQAETDFRAGKIDADQFHAQVLHARVQTAGTKAVRDALAKEEQRIAEDNPKLPIWLRASMIENDYGANGGRTYHSIAMANGQYNWAGAARLGSSDISDLFSATAADLASVHPIHAEAVKKLRERVISTGLDRGSPWSDATKNHVVDNLLHISSSDYEIPKDRLGEFFALPSVARILVRKTLQKRLDDEPDNHRKTGIWIAVRALEGKSELTGEKLAAVKLATDRYQHSDHSPDAYRNLDPLEFDELPTFTKHAIIDHLMDAQGRAARHGAVRTWTPGHEDALDVFPAALIDHLRGARLSYGRHQDAVDVASYGQKIINPYDRVKTYATVPIGDFRKFPQGTQSAIHDDLDKIAADTSLTLPVRYKAKLTRDVLLDSPTNISSPQLVAIRAADPSPSGQVSDADAVIAFTSISKADYDALDSVYRDAIDARLVALAQGHSPGPAQLLAAKFHPTVPAANPSGVTPTVQANIPPHVQAALDTIYGVHPKSHTMAHQLATYSALRGSDFAQLNPQEQTHLLSDLSFIQTTAKGPSADKARKLIDRFTPAGTPSGQIPPQPVIPPANAVPGQVRYATPLKGLEMAKDSGKSGDGWLTLPGGQRVWGHNGAAGLLLMHQDPQTGEKRYLMVQRGPAISDPGKWTFPGGASDSKETPHQGAARETIEELGLADDALKDALVHGDHTFTVPGSTWKYTTVAAQVPTMIKPNLSTAHARAETSDAKWMTEAEIKALDRQGQLHHPIAGGKLEQNVISLFPQAGTGTTLGQIVRPGPVSKRPKRLKMPSGGRQSPANFNAWPHAHKPSKGKDLIPDRAALDAQRQKIKQDRKLYDGKTADGRLAAIGAQQGFDDTPTVVSKSEIDRLLATGDYIEAWRGVSGAGGRGWRARGSSGGKTAEQIHEEMRSGTAYYGTGIFGNGYYLATQRSVAVQYADGTKGSVVRMLIPKSAVTRKYDEVKTEAFKNPSRSQAKGSSSYETSTFYDPGRYAAAKGIDGIEIEHHHRSPGGGASHVAARGKPAFNWLNRSVLIVQKEPG